MLVHQDTVGQNEVERARPVGSPDAQEITTFELQAARQFGSTNPLASSIEHGLHRIYTDDVVALLGQPGAVTTIAAADIKHRQRLTGAVKHDHLQMAV
jgi:hypothetical protein